MNVKRLPLLALVAIVLAGCGSGNGADNSGSGSSSGSGVKPDTSSGPVTLRLKPPVGAKYKVEEISESNGHVATMVIDREVKSASDQSIHFESTVTDVKGDAILVIGLKMDTEFTPRYAVKANSTASSNPEFKTVANNVLVTLKTAPSLPENAVKPGDTWKTTFSLPDMFPNTPGVQILGEKAVPVDCTFVGTRDEGGRKVAVVMMKCEAKSSLKYKDQTQKLDVKIDGEYRYDLETGMLLYSVQNKSTSSEADSSSLKTTTTAKPVK